MVQPNRKQRRTRQIAEARAHILEHALEVFGTNGYHWATMEDVADASGYSVGSLYNYFENKAALYRAVVDQIAEEVRSVSPPEAVEHEPDFRAALARMMRRQFEIAKRHRGFFSSFFRERASFDARFGTQVDVRTEAVREARIDGIEALVIAGQRAGQVKNASSRVVALTIAGAFEGLFRAWLSTDAALDLDDAVTMMVDLVYCGIWVDETERA